MPALNLPLVELDATPLVNVMLKRAEVLRDETDRAMAAWTAPFITASVQKAIEAADVNPTAALMQLQQISANPMVATNKYASAFTKQATEGIGEALARQVEIDARSKLMDKEYRLKTQLFNDTFPTQQGGKEGLLWEKAKANVFQGILEKELDLPRSGSGGPTWYQGHNIEQNAAAGGALSKAQSDFQEMTSIWDTNNPKASTEERTAAFAGMKQTIENKYMPQLSASPDQIAALSQTLANTEKTLISKRAAGDKAKEPKVPATLDEAAGQRLWSEKEVQKAKKELADIEAYGDKQLLAPNSGVARTIYDMAKIRHAEKISSSAGSQDQENKLWGDVLQKFVDGKLDKSEIEALGGEKRAGQLAGIAKEAKKEGFIPAMRAIQDTEKKVLEKDGTFKRPSVTSYNKTFIDTDAAAMATARNSIAVAKEGDMFDAITKSADRFNLGKIVVTGRKEDIYAAISVKAANEFANWYNNNVGLEKETALKADIVKYFDDASKPGAKLPGELASKIIEAASKEPSYGSGYRTAIEQAKDFLVATFDSLVQNNGHVDPALESMGFVKRSSGASVAQPSPKGEVQELPTAAELKRGAGGFDF